MSRFYSHIFIALLVIVGARSAMFVPTTFAQSSGEGATIIVSTTDDALADDGLCSLREAITSANQDEALYESAGECIAGMGPDTIVLTTGIYAIAITDPNTTDENENASGDFDIKSEITISGNGAADTQISGAGLDRVFHFQESAIGRINKVRIFNGRTLDGNSGEAGGGILNEGYLLLSEVIVDNNQTGMGLSQPVNSTSVCAQPNAPPESGGNGGGICNHGALFLFNSTVTNNTTGAGGDGGAGGYGAGIFNNSGTIYVEYSEISHNEAGKGGLGPTGGVGGIGGEGGGIFSVNGGSYLSHSDVSYNRSGDGGPAGTNGISGAGGTAGGIFNAALFGNGHISILQSTIHHNTTGSGRRGGDGVGIYTNGFLLLEDSLVAFNQAGNGTNEYGGRGGGIAIAPKGNATITRSAILNNRAGDNNAGRAGDGGGFYVFGSTLIIASTIAQNQAGQGLTDGQGGGFISASSGNTLDPMRGIIDVQDSTIVDNTAQAGGGVVAVGASQMTFRNTIIAHNHAPTAPNCGGTLNSGGYLLIGDDSGCTITGSTTGVQTGVDPLLGTLVSAEDAPPYYPLLANSPALDSGSCPNLQNDQRNSPRPIDLPTTTNLDDGCDIGAIEAQLVEATPHYINVSETGDTDVYSITLNYTPTTPVTISLSVGNQITVTPEFVVIAPTLWTLPHTITVSALDDDEPEGIHTTTITHTATSSDTIFNGVGIADVTVIISDDESEIPPVPTPIPTALELSTVTSTSAGSGIPLTNLVTVGIVLGAAVVLFRRRR